MKDPIMILEVKAALQIAKPPHEVFEAIVNPAQMRNYFIERGSERMETGKTVVWKFPEFDGEFPVKIGKVEKDKSIAFEWGGPDGKPLTVEITLTPAGVGATVVRITEKGMENDAAGLAWLVGNTEGWANFLACMKAWLEYGIHLREGAFDFMKNPE